MKSLKLLFLQGKVWGYAYCKTAFVILSYSSWNTFSNNINTVKKTNSLYIHIYIYTSYIYVRNYSLKSKERLLHYGLNRDKWNRSKIGKLYELELFFLSATAKHWQVLLYNFCFSSSTTTSHSIFMVAIFLVRRPKLNFAVSSLFFPLLFFYPFFSFSFSFPFLFFFSFSFSFFFSSSISLSFSLSFYIL